MCWKFNNISWYIFISFCWHWQDSQPSTYVLENGIIDVVLQEMPAVTVGCTSHISCPIWLSHANASQMNKIYQVKFRFYQDLFILVSLFQFQISDYNTQMKEVFFFRFHDLYPTYSTIQQSISIDFTLRFRSDFFEKNELEESCRLYCKKDEASAGQNNKWKKKQHKQVRLTHQHMLNSTNLLVGWGYRNDP